MWELIKGKIRQMTGLQQQLDGTSPNGEMTRFRFGPARVGETSVYGAERPGYNSRSVDAGPVQEWIAFMKENGILRVCCLLSPKQLAYYQPALLDQYGAAFGVVNVCAVEVDDYNLCDQETLELKVLPFFYESDRVTARVVVHCSGGSGRTGHVLAAWLVRHRELSVDDALAAVVATDRNPYEAVQCGNATNAQLRRLLAGNTPRAV